jgi:uncharacterized Tic20 family protein
MDTPQAIPAPGVSAFAPMTRSEEQNMAALAHASMLINLVSGFFGVLAALILYLMYQDRSRYASFHSLQSLIFQFGGLVLPGVLLVMMWIAVVALIFAFGIGLLLLPVAILVSILAALIIPVMVVYSLYGAVQCLSGRDFRYWLAGNLAEKILAGGDRNAISQKVEASTGA